MRDINYVSVVGRLIRDPEIRQPGNNTLITFTVACNRGKSREGTDLGADFIKCRAWRGRAEALAQFVKKGVCILITGSLYTDSYNDKNGIRRTEAGVNITDFRVIPSLPKKASKASKAEVPQENSGEGEHVEASTNQTNVPF